jgi:hypothetical protein
MTIPTLTDFIWYKPGRVDSSFCDEVVNRAKNSQNFYPAPVGSGTGTVNVDIRDVSITGINQWSDLDAKFFQIYGDAIQDYADKHRDLVISRDEGYTLLRYGSSQHYAQHVDYRTDTHRAVTAIIGLNDEYEGGEFWMWDGAWRQRVEKGAVLLFPSTFEYPHGIRPIESGVRYSVITWFS